MSKTAEQPPEPNPSSAPQSAASSPAEPLADAKREAAENYDRYLRAVADLENFRRRTVREKDELRLYSAGRILEDLLPVLDHLGLALAAARQPDADLKGLVGGVDLVLQQFKGVLANHGLVEFSPLGQPFDPHRHEAISHQPSVETAAEHVLTVVRSGYVLNQRLLRPAAVVVSSGPAAAGQPG